MLDAAVQREAAAGDVPREDFYDHDDSDNTCYLCNDPQYELLHEVTHYGFPFVFKRCQCGLIKQTPMPNERFFEWFFNAELFFSSKQTNKSAIWGFYDYFKDEPCRLATSRRRYRKLRHVFETRRPLDVMKVGPSTGSFLHVAQQHGHRVLGCDVSERFVAYARDTYGVTIDHGRFERLRYDDGQFDVIMLFNVIENVPNQVEFLSEVHRTLRPGGAFILNFVNERANVLAAAQKERYFLYRPPICYVYSLSVMRRVLAKFDFEVAACMRDIRYLHIEKIATLLGWRFPLAVSERLGIHHTPFPIYAYPSRIVVARRRD